MANSENSGAYDARPLTYEDGYREGLAAGRASLVKGADLALRQARAVNEPPSRVAFLLEAIALAMLASGDSNG